jgi:diaminohydroxyphosphoribosylaminopyrimidine deaminase/5-amino-6-(5-phosphoribosylamino)uracil reductase
MRSHNPDHLNFTNCDRNLQLKQKLRDRQVEVLELDDISPEIVMQELGDRGYNTFLWECG